MIIEFKICVYTLELTCTAIAISIKSYVFIHDIVHVRIFIIRDFHKLLQCIVCSIRRFNFLQRCTHAVPRRHTQTVVYSTCEISIASKLKALVSSMLLLSTACNSQ